MSYLEVFRVLAGVGVDVSKIFRVGAVAVAGVLKRGAGAESESEKCDSAHLCGQLATPFGKIAISSFPGSAAYALLILLSTFASSLFLIWPGIFLP